MTLNQISQNQIALPKNTVNVPHKVHSVETKSGFLQADIHYVYAFDADKKQRFLDVFRANGLKCKAACKALGISFHTLQKHYALDPVFKERFEDVQQEVADDIQAKSIAVALTDRGFMDRAMQLRRLRPEQYAPEQKNLNGEINISIVVGGETIELSNKREKIMEAKIAEEVKSVELQQVVEKEHKQSL